MKITLKIEDYPVLGHQCYSITKGRKNIIEEDLNLKRDKHGNGTNRLAVKLRSWMKVIHILNEIPNI